MSIPSMIGGTSTQVANVAQQSAVTFGSRVYHMFQNRCLAGVTLAVSTVVGSILAVIVGGMIYERFLSNVGRLSREERESWQNTLRTYSLLFVPTTLLVGGINLGVSKLLNLPFSSMITVPLTMAIFVFAANYFISQSGQG